MLANLLHDVRYSIRMLSKRPGFTLLVIIIMAAGTGANTAVFSVINAFLLRPLPYEDADRLVRVQSIFAGKERDVSFVDYMDWKEQSESFEDMVFFSPSWLTNVTFDGETEAIPGVLATANLFSALRVAPLIGRSFLPSDGGAQGETVAIISHDFWQRRFGADPNILGQHITTDSGIMTVIGVMPAGFKFPAQSEMWVAADKWFNRQNRAIRIDKVIARLKPAATLDQARAEMETISARLAAQYPDTNAGIGAIVVSERDLWVASIRPSLVLLLGAVAFVLLIACANVANLLLARAGAREKEMAIRTALGARRARLIRQLLTESVIFSLLGGAAGLLMAEWAIEILKAMLPSDLPFWVEIRIDLAALAFTLALCVLTGLSFGLAPALQASRLNLNESLKDGSRALSGGLRRRALRRALVISEVALALVLLVGAGLMMKSFLKLRQTSPGFDAERALMIEVNTPPRRDPGGAAKAQLYKEVLERLAALPGVEAVGANSDLPLVGQEAWDRLDFTVEGQSADEQKMNPIANSQHVSPDYFRAMGIPLISGRFFTEEDRAQNRSVAIINRQMAERFWPGQDPIGKRIKAGGVDSQYGWDEIIGVVGDVKHHGLALTSGMDWYAPFYNRWKEIHFVVRTQGDPAALAADARREIWRVSADLGISRTEPLTNLAANSIWQPRLWGLLVGAFSALALVLSAAGIYSVMSYVVSQRTHEIGVRMALGARPRDVFKMVLTESMLMVAIGCALGLVGAIASSRIIAAQLHGVAATDPAILAGVVALFAGVALAASFVPARKATRVDPIAALRHE